MFTQKFGAQVPPLQIGFLTTCVYPLSPSGFLPLTRPGTDPADINAICRSLTARQRDVLAVLLQGKTNKAICRVLNLAEPTVKNHITAILKALKVANRTEAVIKVSAAAAVSFASKCPASGDRHLNCDQR
jgi:DNA-binding CsgD family transcriptional regulator